MTLVLTGFWDAMRTRIETAEMQEMLGGAGRVYVPSDGHDDILEVEGGPGEQWGRIIILPRETLWPQTDEPGAWQNVAFLPSVQFNDFRAPGYDVGLAIARVHQELYARLDNWVPDPQPDDIVVTVPVWRHGSPPVSPIFDQERNLWLSNAEYRCQAVSR